MERLEADAGALHGLDVEARRFAMGQLHCDFEQLRHLTRHLRDLATRSVKAFETLDLSDTLDCITSMVAQTTAATQVRSLASSMCFLPCATGHLLAVHVPSSVSCCW